MTNKKETKKVKGNIELTATMADGDPIRTKERIVMQERKNKLDKFANDFFDDFLQRHITIKYGDVLPYSIDKSDGELKRYCEVFAKKGWHDVHMFYNKFMAAYEIYISGVRVIRIDHEPLDYDKEFNVEVKVENKKVFNKLYKGKFGFEDIKFGDPIIYNNFKDDYVFDKGDGKIFGKTHMERLTNRTYDMKNILYWTWTDFELEN